MQRDNIKKGFTLLEILLVVGIISLLSAIVIIAINPSKMLAQARDTQRRSGISEINKALVQYYIDESHFPSSLTDDLVDICPTGSSATSTGIDCEGKVDLSMLVPDYLPAIPVDPTGVGYQIGLNSSHNVMLAAPLTESGPPIIAMGTTTSSGANHDSGGGDDNNNNDEIEAGIVSGLRVGLTGYWPLDDVGTTFMDESGAGHGGTCVGVCPTFLIGKVNNARSFSSSNNAITLSSANSLPSGTTARTACSWVKPSALDAYEWAFSWGSGGTCEFVGVCGNSTCLGRWGNQLQEEGDTININEWSYLCYTYENSTNKAYINGQLVQTLGRTWSISPGDAYIGRQSYLTSEYWKGAVDEVAIWSRALTDSEISQLYNGGSGRSLIQ